MHEHIHAHNEEILTPEMKELIKKLGELVKADQRHLSLLSAIDEYEHSEDLNSLIEQYNDLQDELSENYRKGGDSEAAKAINKNIDNIYDTIMDHPVYSSYADAKEDFDKLTAEINAELQFVITGSRPCAHDCSSCHSDCGHSH